MLLPLPVRIEATLAACALAAAGCGQSSPLAAERLANPQQAATAGDVHAPRTIELSANVRRLLPVQDDFEPANGGAAMSVEACGSATSAPRICEVSATPDSAGQNLIREPGALPAEVKEPGPLAAAVNRQRSAFVPLVMPEIRPPAAGALPQLAARPAFDRPIERRPAPALAAAPPGAAARVDSYPPAQVPRPAPAFTPVAYPTTAAPPPAAAASASPPVPPIARSLGIQAATEQATRIADQALVMAQRGMLFSARTELLKALQLIAQGLDADQGSAVHASALSAGLTALDEAGDFAHLPGQAGDNNNALAIAGRHRTRLLRSENIASLTPMAAQQQYLAFAQSQLAIAAGGLPAASQTLYRLGRVQTALSATQSDSQALPIPRAIVLHQAALATDSKNHLAANELGVLLAQCGQLADARSLLLQSVSIRPHAEAWHNLAVVHRRLGEADLAQRAEHERDLAANQPGSARVTGENGVRWVDAKTFAASAGQSPRQDAAEQELARVPASQWR
jgi:tetratricopeptide (TPR) repeat protein